MPGIAHKYFYIAAYFPSMIEYTGNYDCYSGWQNSGNVLLWQAYVPLAAISWFKKSYILTI